MTTATTVDVIDDMTIEPEDDDLELAIGAPLTDYLTLIDEEDIR